MTEKIELRQKARRTLIVTVGSSWRRRKKEQADDDDEMKKEKDPGSLSSFGPLSKKLIS